MMRLARQKEAATHVSLFNRSLCGRELDGGRIFGVQYHPEASPGPQDSAYLFGKFVDMHQVHSVEGGVT